MDNNSINRKELLQSTTKFSSDAQSSLTLCTKKSKTLVPKPERLSITHLNLNSFKVFLCKESNEHNKKTCLYFHDQTDRRRSLTTYTYVSDLCEFTLNNKQCIYGDNCKFSHNYLESNYHYAKYKRRFCNYYHANQDKCTYGDLCPYAHSEIDILIDQLHNYVYDSDFFLFYYKTQFCPFSYITHDRGNCVFAHNWQDLRRSPYEVTYQPVQCEFWSQKEFQDYYSDGCANGHTCPKSHGWNELEYHPLIYCTNPCENGDNCKRGIKCPNYHNLSQKRKVDEEVYNNFFRYAPCNRLITGSYKLFNTNPNSAGGSGIIRSVTGNLISASKINQSKENYNNIGFNQKSHKKIGSMNSGEFNKNSQSRNAENSNFNNSKGSGPKSKGSMNKGSNFSLNKNNPSKCSFNKSKGSKNNSRDSPFPFLNDKDSIGEEKVSIEKKEEKIKTPSMKPRPNPTRGFMKKLSSQDEKVHTNNPGIIDELDFLDGNMDNGIPDYRKLPNSIIPENTLEEKDNDKITENDLL